MEWITCGPLACCSVSFIMLKRYPIQLTVAVWFTAVAHLWWCQPQHKCNSYSYNNGLLRWWFLSYAWYTSAQVITDTQSVNEQRPQSTSFMVTSKNGVCSLYNVCVKTIYCARLHSPAEQRVLCSVEQNTISFLSAQYAKTNPKNWSFIPTENEIRSLSQH